MSIFSSEKPFASTALEMHCLFSLQLEKQIHSMHFPLCLSPLNSCFFCLCFWVQRIFLKINKNDRNNFFNELAMIASIEWPVETAHFSKCNCVCSAFVFFLRWFYPLLFLRFQCSLACVVVVAMFVIILWHNVPTLCGSVHCESISIKPSFGHLVSKRRSQICEQKLMKCLYVLFFQLNGAIGRYP